MLWEGEAFLEKPFTFEGLAEAVSLLLFGTVKSAGLRRIAAHKQITFDAEIASAENIPDCLCVLADLRQRSWTNFWTRLPS